MEDGIERSMSSLITDLEKKQRTTKPKYEEQVHPIGLSLTGRTETTPIGHDNTPTGRQETIDKTLGTTPIHNLQETPSTNTGSDS